MVSAMCLRNDIQNKLVSRRVEILLDIVEKQWLLLDN